MDHRKRKLKDKTVMILLRIFLDFSDNMLLCNLGFTRGIEYTSRFALYLECGDINLETTNSNMFGICDAKLYNH